LSTSIPEIDIKPHFLNIITRAYYRLKNCNYSDLSSYNCTLGFFTGMGLIVTYTIGYNKLNKLKNKLD
jgi:hypothetical protein